MGMELLTTAAGIDGAMDSLRRRVDGRCVVTIEPMPAGSLRAWEVACDGGDGVVFVHADSLDGATCVGCVSDRATAERWAKASPLVTALKERAAKTKKDPRGTLVVVWEK